MENNVELLWEITSSCCGKLSEPRRGQKRDVQLGSHSELDCLSLQVTTPCLSDSCLCDSIAHSC